MIEELISKFKNLEIQSAVNYEEFNNILITSHSTRIEGSTLSIEQAAELINAGLTPGGKSITLSLMTLDHHNALIFTLKQAEEKRKISVGFIKEIAAKVMEHTGEIYQNVLGTVDVSKGDFRNTSVRAGTVTFMNFQKIGAAMEDFADELNQQIEKMETVEEQLLLSFYAHYKLVDIHPFLDGNGRTSRLLMNFVQRYHGLPLGIVFSEDKPQYYQALNSVREDGNFDRYNSFMMSQYSKNLQNEIQKTVMESPEIKPRFKR